ATPVRRADRHAVQCAVDVRHPLGGRNSSLSSGGMNEARYRPDIDGLRAIAVLMVVAYHAAPARLPGGFIGVDVFFVISGYLITTIILRGLDSGSFSFPHFYANRVRRIFPALLVVLGCGLLAGWRLLLVPEFSQLGK